MELTVFFNPVELTNVDASADDIYIVIDVMRATTTTTVMLDQGARRIFAADTIEQACTAAPLLGAALCGERHAKPLPGFDYGNSPAQFAAMDLADRDFILTTSNGTKALFACPSNSTRLVGSFYNGQAVISHALALAQERNCNISLVCAAEYGYFSLEDATCAGFLALELLHQQPHCQVNDSVHAAISLYENYPASRLLEIARSARDLYESGQQEDLIFCVTKNESQSVGTVVGIEQESKLLIIERCEKVLPL